MCYLAHKSVKFEQIHLTQLGISLPVFTFSSRYLYHFCYDLYHRHAIHYNRGIMLGFLATKPQILNASILHRLVNKLITF